VPEITRSFDLARSHALYKLLLERFAPMLSDKRHLLLVPTGALSSLPFQVLVTEPPRGAGSGEEAQKGAAWLIRRHALSVLPSVQSLSALRQLMSSGGAPKPFFGIGDPVLVGPAALNKQKRDAKRPVIERAAFYRNGLADIGALRELVPLPETADELRAVAKSLGAPPEAISLREDATETRVKTAKLSDYRVIHFATHGLVAGDLDGLSEPALVLTPPLVATETDDGLLTASEIATLRLNAEWVVLSACNTAAGDRVGADALSGLARAFFFSGARAILVSHWAVYSQAAVHLTTQTFATLAHMPEIGRAEAFRRSMLALIDQGAPPSFWAPFVVVGEGAAFPTDPAPR
jgi:CHAT domain-containing protein